MWYSDLPWAILNHFCRGMTLSVVFFFLSFYVINFLCLAFHHSTNNTPVLEKQSCISLFYQNIKFKEKGYYATNCKTKYSVCDFTVAFIWRNTVHDSWAHISKLSSTDFHTMIHRLSIPTQTLESCTVKVSCFSFSACQETAANAPRMAQISE